MIQLAAYTIMLMSHYAQLAAHTIAFQHSVLCTIHTSYPADLMWAPTLTCWCLYQVLAVQLPMPSSPCDLAEQTNGRTPD